MSNSPYIIHTGKFLELVSLDSWEFVRRVGGPYAVGIVALTPENNLLLISQFRIPVGKTVIEIPAGLVGDTAPRPGSPPESWQTAALRELREETGWSAGAVERLTEGPTSSGLTSERLLLVLATGLVKIGPQQLDGEEQITVHEVPLPEVHAWLQGQENAGAVIDPKVWAALYFLKCPPAASPPAPATAHTA